MLRCPISFSKDFHSRGKTLGKLSCKISLFVATHRTSLCSTLSIVPGVAVTNVENMGFISKNISIRIDTWRNARDRHGLGKTERNFIHRHESIALSNAHGKHNKCHQNYSQCLLSLVATAEMHRYEYGGPVSWAVVRKDITSLS